MAVNIGKAALALGALLAYQNRDKIADLLNKNRSTNDPNSPGGGLLDDLLGGGSARNGLSDILDRFRGAGGEKEVESWIGKEPNQPLNKHQVEAAIDAETLEQLSTQTGLTREELVERITRDLPAAVDSLTPDGRLPDTKATKPAGGNLLDDVPVRNRSI